MLRAHVNNLEQQHTPEKYGLIPSLVDTVQDFLINLGIKPGMHLSEISILSLYTVIVRPTKIMNRADKNWVQF